MGRVDSLGFWLLLIFIDYLLAFVIAMFCIFAAVDVAEWWRVIIAGILAPFVITLAAFFGCQLLRI